MFYGSKGLDILGFTKSVISLVVLWTLLSPFASIEAPAQSSRPRQVKSPPAQKSKQKRAARPLTAKEHRAAEQRLSDLGYWTGRIDGRWDTASHHALIAFQKVEGLKRTGRLTRADYDRLMMADRPVPFETGAEHIEVDLDRQVLFLVDETGTVTRILPVSTGSGRLFTSQGVTREAQTWPGRYKIRSRIAGWKTSPLGRMYYPNYFMWGTAIHGYPSVPTRPASHGCVRIPMFAAKPFSRLAKIGMDVIIHRNGVTIPNAVIAEEDK